MFDTFRQSREIKRGFLKIQMVFHFYMLKQQNFQKVNGFGFESKLLLSGTTSMSSIAEKSWFLTGQISL